MFRAPPCGSEVIGAHGAPRVRVALTPVANVVCYSRVRGGSEGVRGDMATDHKFGGPWTITKLEILKAYLNFYPKALKNQGFELWYIDAFAGSGSFRLPGFENLGLGLDSDAGDREGSARIALDTKPPFDRYVFIDDNRRRIDALAELTGNYPHLKTETLCGDANALVQEICRGTSWYGSRPRRGVIFLDPYGMSVDWRTLEEIRKTRALDLWYLFPTGALVRQLAKNFSRVDEYKQSAIDKILGTTEWRNELYAPPPPGQGELFPPADSEDEEDRELRRNADVLKIRNYVWRRLQKTFPYVEEPVRLPRRGGPYLFDLYVAVSNDSPAAISLAKKVVRHILRQK